jgi:hypothetical protein
VRSARNPSSRGAALNEFELLRDADRDWREEEERREQFNPNAREQRHLAVTGQELPEDEKPR